ncbi:hypothetical protein EX30DRAFT_364390 [Ascodesmis nigricans]|uniref:Uncharacterized protein n=1 Tax=Ascodesmis nigricans TaxID=341454 RepID=A0A4S2MVW3_9PEZI|nr:hypothetical protein EX30DRAFT_364390 [Ascodesmis nigricans]
MQLLRAAAVLTAVLPALAIAAICDNTAIDPPDSVEANYDNIDEAFIAITEKYINERKTTVLRVDASLSLTLSNGDITIPGGGKANVFNNVKPIEEYLLTQAELASTASDVTGKTSATGTAASVPTESASQSQSGTAAAPSQTLDESAAGKIVVGGWVAVVAALAAVVVVA